MEKHVLVSAVLSIALLASPSSQASTLPTLTLDFGAILVPGVATPLSNLFTLNPGTDPSIVAAEVQLLPNPNYSVSGAILGPAPCCANYPAMLFGSSSPFSSSPLPPWTDIDLTVNLGVSGSVPVGGFVETATSTSTGIFITGNPFGGNIPTGPSTPPSVVTLAKLAYDVYGANQGADGYNLVSPIVQNNGFAANVYKNGDQIVIATRGSDLSTLSFAAYNLLSDTSFVNGNPSPFLASEVNQLVSVLAGVYNSDPTAQITLTGHSLGGALAQIVGQAAHASVTSFDAPGPAALLPALAPELQNIPNVQSSSSGITNYRLYGDQISKVGTQLGPTITVDQPFFSNTSIDANLLLNPFSFLANHDMAMLRDDLISGAQTDNGNIGVNITPLIVLPIQLGLQVLGPVVGFAATIINAATELLFDPGPADRYLLQIASGSPLPQSIELPFSDNIAAWMLQYFDGSTWSIFQQITSPGDFVFPSNVEAVQFVPLNALADPIFNRDFFAFGLTFTSTGDFKATVTEFQPTAVPEPGTLTLLGGALFGLVLILRWGTWAPRERYSCA